MVGGSLQGVPQFLAESGAVVDNQNGCLRRRRNRLTATQELSRARDDVARVIGLADVFVRPGRESADAVSHLSLGGEQHHCSPLVAGRPTDLLEELHTIAVREENVEDDEGELFLCECPARFGYGGASDCV